MPVFRRRFELTTTAHNQVVNITTRVGQIVAESGARDGMCTVFTLHTSAAITVQESDDPNIGIDFMVALRKVILEHDGWLHDGVDNNAAAHIKSAVVGASETLPVEDGKLLLGTWQNLFFCEFDGPRKERSVVVTVVS